MNAKRLLLASLLAVSCGPNLSPTWPSKTGDVTAALSSASLAQDCASESPSRGDSAAICADKAPCPSFCRQSNLQLSLVSTQQDGARVEVRAVRLLDKASGAVLDTLTARKPQQWTGSAYGAWDQVVGGGVSLKVSFDLSAPDWAKITKGDGLRAYGVTYRVQVDLAIDGVVHTLEVEAQREPEVVT